MASLVVVPLSLISQLRVKVDGRLDCLADARLRLHVRIQIEDGGPVCLRPEDEVSLVVGDAHQVDEVFNHKCNVAVSPIKGLTWILEVLLVLDIQL